MLNISKQVLVSFRKNKHLIPQYSYAAQSNNICSFFTYVKASKMLQLKIEHNLPFNKTSKKVTHTKFFKMNRAGLKTASDAGRRGVSTDVITAATG